MSAAVRGRAFQGLLLLSLAIGFAVLAWLLVASWRRACRRWTGSC